MLFLTARDALPDRISGFTAGGDDYVTKPFSFAEVVARLRALLRRGRRRRRRVESGGLRLDPVDACGLAPARRRSRSRRPSSGCSPRSSAGPGEAVPAARADPNRRGRTARIVRDNTLDTYLGAAAHASWRRCPARRLDHNRARRRLHARVSAYRSWRGVRGRLLLVVLAAVVVAIAATIFGFNRLFTDSSTRDANALVRGRAASALTGVQVVNGKVRVREVSADAELDGLVWVFSSGRVIEKPRAEQAVDLAARQLAGATVSPSRRRRCRHPPLRGTDRERRSAARHARGRGSP